MTFGRLSLVAVALANVLPGIPVIAQTPMPLALMPQPSSLTRLRGDLVITQTLRVAIHTTQDPLLQNAAQRMIFELERHTALQLDRTLSEEGSAAIQIEVADHAQQRPADGMDESYTLDVKNGSAVLHARTDFGALRGMQTLLQLVGEEGQGYTIPAVHIEDGPRFPWRGLLLDPGRHFLPVSNVLRTLDAMEAVKLNVLHFHLTEDQGFRIESKLFPRLQQMGSDGQFYTQAEIRQIVAYATERGIRVVPEFDVPGHSTSWLVGYPELGSKAGPYQIERTTGVKDPALDPTRESTYSFLDSFIGEMTTLFPDEYIHIGGDESNGKHWLGNPAIVDFMHQHNMKTTGELQAYFNARVQKLLLKHHRRMVGWDEILQPDLSPEVVVQNWHGIEFLVDAARRGHRGILSKPFYLDHSYSAAEMYAADPIPAGEGLTPAQQKLILGGEACMWGEQADFNTVDSRIWPRAAAVAERLWSPADVRDVQDMYRRLAAVSNQLDVLGVTHVSNPQRGRRQLTGGDADALEVFATVVRPVDFGERYKEQHTSTLTPLTNVVDFVVPDPLSSHVFAGEVAAYLQSTAKLESEEHAAARTLLKQTFNRWAAAADRLDAQSPANPRLATVAERRNQMRQLSRLGLQAVERIESHQPASASWLSAQETLLKDCAQPKELLDFAVLTPLQDLLHAASGQEAKH